MSRTKESTGNIVMLKRSRGEAQLPDRLLTWNPL